ncbi:hypothetical protein [Phenylobacterium sp.]|uniref:hypothetical protein n=1 Tax=Phenylobacterium sp. TaxID=1871053 RepID=UPI0011F41635|nr:hypothetical protein [Phenylobacterium sp.]THD54616.1 MAG: hypothetical protein E8A12_16865 [Phenylobacterium sp.]
MTVSGTLARRVAAAMVIAALSGPALAADPAPAATPERAKEVQELADCAKLTDAAARLACYDKAAHALDQAEAKGDVVVVNREQARKVRRQAFGFTLPSMSIFSRGEKPEDIVANETTVVSARKALSGKWVLKLEDGSTWSQVDLTDIPIDPKAGDKVKIHKASMGSYLATIANQREVRVHRDE